MYIYIHHSFVPCPFTQMICNQGGHNYAFDIALGLHDASVALSSPLTMNLLGYAFAEKYAAAAEYCQQPSSNFDRGQPARKGPSDDRLGIGEASQNDQTIKFTWIMNELMTLIHASD